MTSSFDAGSASGRTGRQVLIGERVADQRIAGAVVAPRERAEGRRNPSRLNVDGPIAPRPHAQIQRVRLHAVAVLAADFREHRDPARDAHVGRHADPEQAQRVVLVVCIVEPRAVGVVLRRGRDGDIRSEGDDAVRQRHGTREEVLRARRRCEAERQRRGHGNFHVDAHTIIGRLG